MAYARKGLEVAFLPGGTPRKGAHFIIQIGSNWSCFMRNPCCNGSPILRNTWFHKNRWIPPKKNMGFTKMV